MTFVSDVDDIFEDVRIASLYDLFNPWMAGDDFYFERVTRRGGAALVRKGGSRSKPVLETGWAVPSPL